MIEIKLKTELKIRNWTDDFGLKPVIKTIIKFKKLTNMTIIIIIIMTLIISFIIYFIILIQIKYIINI